MSCKRFEKQPNNTTYARRQEVSHPVRPQATHPGPTQSLRPLDASGAAAAVLPRGADFRHQANVVADTLSRPPPSAVASVKEPPGSLATARQGGKPNSSTPSVPERWPAASAAAGAARPPLLAVVSVKEPAGSLTTAWQRGKPNPSSSTPAGQLAASAAAVSAAPATAAEPVSSPASGKLDLLLLADAQAGCIETQEMAASTSLKIKFFHLGGKNLMCDVSLANPRPTLVPTSFRRVIFNSIHSIANPSIRATKRMISAHYVWKGMGADIRSFCRDCQRCARGKVTATVHTQIQPIQLPVKRFSHVHIDIVGASAGLAWRLHSPAYHGG
jgi:hypothetical protein